MLLNAEKIQEFIINSKVKKKDIAKYCGVSYSYFCGLCSLRNRLSARVLNQLSELTQYPKKDLLL